MDVLENCFGGMDESFIQERLSDFNCDLALDVTDEAVNKLNALSTTYSISNVNLIDGLIAFLKNSKKTEVTLAVLDEYEQVLSKTSTAAPFRAPTNLQPDREILRELTFATDFEECTIADEEQQEEAGNCIEFGAFDDDKHYEPYTKRENAKNAINLQNTRIDQSVKSKYTGSNFMPDSARETSSTIQPTLRLLCDCEPSSYSYGHNNVLDGLCELFPSSEQLQDVEENEELPSTIAGTIFPSEGNYLTFDNAMLFTNSEVLQLNFQQIDKISIYPGMKLTAKCRHSSGICHVFNLIEPPPLEMPDLTINRSQFSMFSAGNLFKNAVCSSSAHLKVFIMSGPYFSENKDFQQFVQFLHLVDSVNANALILTGPFVPHNMELLAETPESIFAEFLNTIVKQLNNRNNIRILILPNALSDLYSLPFFPTPPLVTPANLSLPKCITFVPDPAIFELENVRFAVSSSEILMHLCRKEIYKSTNVENEDRMRRLTSHLFKSRSLYPLYPSDSSLALSLPSGHDKVQLNKKPHVLILPSLLQPVTKVVGDCVLINPGRFIRGKSVGTFTFLDVDLDNFSGVTNSISQFCEVSLLATPAQ